MSIPTPDTFQTLLARSGLLDQATLASCGQVLESAADAKGAARWLVENRVITKWQAQQLLAGRGGPFFLGDYRLLARHEFPGPARAFSARHEPSSRIVNLVWLDRGRCEDPAAWNELVRRTTAAARTQSPVASRTWALEQISIAGQPPAGQPADERILVCERVTGEPLADELARLGPLPLVEAGTTMHAIATAVAELHAAGDVHGDLSLDTVVREPGGPPRSGRVRLLQFPLSGDPHRHPVRPLLGSTEEIAALGRRSVFVAPELTLPGTACDTRSDVYALGCMLQAVVTGSLPGWQGDPRTTLLDARTRGLPPPGPDVPGEVAALIRYCTSADPSTRYPSAAEVTAALATCFGIAAAPAPAANVASGVNVASSVDEFVPTVRPTVVAAAPRGSRRERRPPPPQSTEAWLLRVMAWMLGVFLTVMIGLTVWWRYRDRPRRPSTPPPVAQERTEEMATTAPDARTAGAELHASPASSGTSGPAAVDAAASRVETVSGAAAAALPWMSPTTAPPPTLAYTAPGSQGLLLMRLADIAADPEGSRFLRALGPEVESLLAELERFCGNPLAAVEFLHLAWQTGTDAPLHGMITIGLAPGHAVPADPAVRQDRWGVTTSREMSGETVYAGRIGGRDVDLWVPAAERGRVLVISDRGQGDALVAAAADARATGPDAAVLLPPPVEQVVRMLDGTRHVALVGMPAFLRAGGRALFAGPLEPLAEPVLDLLGDDVEAAALSLHFGRDFFAEIDVVGARSVQPQRLAADLRARLEQLPDRVEEYCVAVSAEAYGRKLVLRLPGMLRVLVANLRAGVEGRGVVVNTRLPVAAGHNIALASELALAEPPGRMAVSTVARAASAAPESTAAKLRRKIDLSFSRDTLEKAIELVSQEIDVPMEILGGDLELEGITQNQSFGLDETNQPAEVVLRRILAKADSAGKLVWVIRDRDGVEWVEITTREAAKKRGDGVPDAATAEPF
jgi:hypothetical protein